MTEEIPVLLHGITWSREHGHPLLLLRALDTDITFAVVADVDEVRALATCACTRERTRRRLAILVADLVRALGAAVVGIQLHIDEHGTLRGTLRLVLPRGVHSFPLAGSDALLLADELGLFPTMPVDEVLTLGGYANERQAPTSEACELPSEVEELLRNLERFGSLDDQSGAAN